MSKLEQRRRFVVTAPDGLEYDTGSAVRMYRYAVFVFGPTSIKPEPHWWLFGWRTDKDGLRRLVNQAARQGFADEHIEVRNSTTYTEKEYQERRRN